MININDALFDEDKTEVPYKMEVTTIKAKAPEPNPDTSNEGKVLKQLFTSIISSINVQKEEAENIKEVKTLLKNNHGITPKQASIITKILMDPSEIEEREKLNLEIDNLISKIGRL
jgi:hypothetical protein